MHAAITTGKKFTGVATARSKVKQTVFLKRAVLIVVKGRGRKLVA